MRSPTPASTGNGSEPRPLEQAACVISPGAPLGIMLTRSCPARCTMCMTSGGPEERAWMGEDPICEILRATW